MKNWIIRILLLIGYCIPFAFLAMNGDITSGTMLFYGIMVIGFALLCWTANRTQNRLIVIMGNLLSCLSSYFFLLQHKTDIWGWYFKPLTANMLLLVISAIMMVLQLVFIYFYNIKRSK